MFYPLCHHSLDTKFNNDMNVQEVLVPKDQMQIIKGKRTKRQRLPSPLRLATPSIICSGGIGHDQITTSATNSIDQFRYRTQEEDEDMANCLILLARGKVSQSQPPPDHKDNINSRLYLYQCKTCKRCFPSFQALGGHRAGHKKPNKANTIGTNEKLVTTFMNEEDHDHYDPNKTNTILSLQIPNRPLPLYRNSTTGTTIAATTKSKAHECSNCGAEFSSGQALGGHMRRHRISISTPTTTTMSMSGGNIIVGGCSSRPESQETKKPRNVLKLDLNLPAPDDCHRESKFTFQTRENVIVFSSPSLVDCHY